MRVVDHYTAQTKARNLVDKIANIGNELADIYRETNVETIKKVENLIFMAYNKLDDYQYYGKEDKPNV